MNEVSFSAIKALEAPVKSKHFFILLLKLAVHVNLEWSINFLQVIYVSTFFAYFLISIFRSLVGNSSTNFFKATVSVEAAFINNYMFTFRLFYFFILGICLCKVQYRHTRRFLTFLQDTRKVS